MLVQEVVGAACALLVQHALGLGPAKSCSIDLSLLFRLLPFNALLEPFQIDYIHHAGLHCPTSRHAAC